MLGDKQLSQVTVREWLILERVQAHADAAEDGAILQEVVDCAIDEARLILLEVDRYMRRQAELEGREEAFALDDRIGIAGDIAETDDGPRFVPDAGD